MHPAKPAKSSRSTAAAPPPASQSASRAPARWSDLLVATKRSDRTIAQLRRELKKKQAAWAALTGQAAPAPAPASASDSVTSLRAALAWYESQDAYVAMVPHLIKHLSLRGGGASPEIAAAVAPFWTAYKTLLANALSKAEELHRALTTLLTPTNPPMSKERKLVYFRKSILYLESLKSMYSTLNGYITYVKDTTKRMTPTGAAEPPTEIPAGLLDAHTPIRETLQLLQNNPNTCRLNSVATPLNELIVIVDAHKIGLGAAGAAPIVSGGGACLAKEPMTFEDLQAKTVEIKKQYEATRAVLGMAPTRPEQTDEELLAELDGSMVDSERTMGDGLDGEFGEIANIIKGGARRRRGRVVKPKSNK